MFLKSVKLSHLRKFESIEFLKLIVILLIIERTVTP